MDLLSEAFIPFSQIRKVENTSAHLRIHKRKFYASLPYLDFTLESQKRISCLQWRIGEDGFSTLPFIPIGLIRVNSTIYVAVCTGSAEICGLINKIEHNN
ncbi:hypothetical protein Tsp_11833 [Trichinella spiralis]|uniref:hypothetical protein n=1 Tax=Trichinella spiralis TaxID=6334 RepID=UPI0001EFE166|nr:hypothetical protein Tsp_11833 [Trichinella spiralis]